MPAPPPHDAAVATPGRERDMKRFGLALFLLAEGVTFITLFSIRFLLTGVERPDELNQLLAGALTGLMLLSALPALEALRAAGRGDAEALRTNLLLTLLIGALLLVGIAWEWAGVEIPAASRYGSVFFTVLGVHAAHVAAGVAVLAGLAVSADLGRFTPQRHFPVEAGVIFWLFVVAAWVLLYAIFYLL